QRREASDNQTGRRWVDDDAGLAGGEGAIAGRDGLAAGSLERGVEGMDTGIATRERVGRRDEGGLAVAAAEGHRTAVPRGEVAEGILGRDGEGLPGRRRGGREEDGSDQLAGGRGVDDDAALAAAERAIAGGDGLGASSLESGVESMDADIPTAER